MPNTMLCNRHTIPITKIQSRPKHVFACDYIVQNFQVCRHLFALSMHLNYLCDGLCLFTEGANCPEPIQTLLLSCLHPGVFQNALKSKNLRDLLAKLSKVGGVTYQNLCEKRIVHGYKKLYSHVSKVQMQNKVPERHNMWYILKSRLFKDVF